MWLHHALASLDADLRSRHGPGAGIVYRHGPYTSSLVAVAEAAAAGVVHFSRRYEPAMQARWLTWRVQWDALDGVHIAAIETMRNRATGNNSRLAQSCSRTQNHSKV